ncbi:MAG: hypothetical protein IT236_15315 [Bacteroidia bacterium]|nr:hypothetical protein [Bacteroidia bacterium]
MTELKKHGLLALSITCLGFILNLVAYFPGFISPDSLDQYQQALTHQYSDWHPPIMAGFWSLLIRIYPGGHLMFLLQLLAFWISFFMLLTLSLKYFKRMTWLVVLLFFAPFIQNFVGNIWKDVGLAISWLLAIAIMLRAYYDARGLSRVETVICFVLLCYGCWIRINALPGVLPLLGIWQYMQKGPVGFNLGTRRFLLNIAGITAIVIGLQFAITKLVLKPSNTYPEYKLFLHDLTGIYKETGTLYFPYFIKNYQGFDTAYIRQKYIYSTFDNIWWNSDNKRIMPEVSADDMKVLQSAWIKAILKHPFVYLKNRTIGFLQFLRITDSGSGLAITYQYIHPNKYNLEFKQNGITRLYYSYVEKQRAAPYMHPWFWLLINLLVLYLAKKPLFYPDRYFTLGLAYSSLFYIALEYIVFQADTEFRYFYWNCVALCLAILVFAFRYAQNKAAKAII